MKEQPNQSPKEIKQAEKIARKEAGNVAREDKTKKAYAAQEELHARAAKVKEAAWAEKRAADEIKDLAREIARKEAYAASEKTLNEAEKARRLKTKGN
jgi:hypothetical protein